MRLQGNTEPVFISGVQHRQIMPEDWKQDRCVLENGERQGCDKSKHDSKIKKKTHICAQTSSETHTTD